MLIDLHTHTKRYSDDSELTPEDLIEQARSSGLDGICFTEHNWHWTEEDIAKLSLEHKFPVFHGIEIGSDEGHLLVFGLPAYNFSMLYARSIKQLVDQVNGAIILAHPYRWQLHFYSNPDDLLEEALKNSIFNIVDAVELLNGRSSDEENKFVQKLCRKLNLRGVGGSDAHSSRDLPACATRFERIINNTRELITELKKGRFQAVDLR